LALATALAQQCAQALERARLYDAERASRAAAEEANRAKSDFLARMSHDLRTPLNAIGGYAQLIEEGIFGVPSDGQRQSLDRIRRAQQHLLMLINDILSFAKLEAGQVNLQLRPVRMSEVFTELRPLVETQAQTKRLRLRLEEGDTDAEVVADRGRLAQILVNLLTNAIKFTEPDGRIDVQCGVLPNTVEIRVCDTGVGIPAERLEAIFDPFIQVKGTAVEPREGVGLGLAISRELARLMHGELAVRSEVGRGSTFTLTLPRVATSEACRVGA
jgi:signal transduction histidine kinase